MGTNYSRPLGLASNQGLPNRVCKNPNSEKFTECTSPVSGQEINSRQGSIRITGEACNSLGESTSSRGGFCKFPVCSPQERGREPPGSQPETAKPVFGLRAFQDGRDPHVKRALKTRGLVGKNRSKRCILNSTHLGKTPEVPSFSVEREHAGVCLPPLWPSNSTQGLQQTHEASNSFTATKRVSHNYLFRRYTFDGRVASSSPLSNSINSEFARKPRFHVNYKKSHLDPVKQLEFLRVLVDTRDLSLYLPGEKLRKIRKQCQNIVDLSEISVRELSKFLGLLASSIQTIFRAPLHFRHLQNLKNKTMAFSHLYEALIQLDQASKEEILWWRDHLQAWNGRALFQKPVELIIETDASRKGWRAYCQGISTGSAWCLQEKSYKSTA